jgi:hypothetical protein
MGALELVIAGRPREAKADLTTAFQSPNWLPCRPSVSGSPLIGQLRSYIRSDDSHDRLVPSSPLSTAGLADTPTMADAARQARSSLKTRAGTSGCTIARLRRQPPWCVAQVRVRASGSLPGARAAGPPPVWADHVLSVELMVPISGRVP